MLREPSGRDTPTGLGVREAWLSEGGVSSSLNKWSPEPASGVEKFPSRHDWATGLGISQANPFYKGEMAEI